MRKLIYLVAITADGYIARKGGSYDCFLQEGEHFSDLFEQFPETVPAHLRSELGVNAPNRHFDTVLMGRHTYEAGSQLGFTNPYPHLRQILFSNSYSQSPDDAVELVATKAVAKVKQLKQEDGQDIWLCGGGQLASLLFSEIDEIILKVNPFVIGSGIPLFNEELPPTQLQLLGEKTYPNGFRISHFKVKHD